MIHKVITWTRMLKGGGFGLTQNEVRSRSEGAARFEAFWAAPDLHMVGKSEDIGSVS